jgi:hypothetical protein
MGAWGSGPFENDSALDWANELVDGDGLGPLQSALDCTAKSTFDYLDVDLGSAAIAAAEVVAALMRKPTSSLPANVAEWIEEHPIKVTHALVAEAAAAVDAAAADNSEVHDLWRESDGYDEWRAAIDDLRARLRPASGP